MSSSFTCHYPYYFSLYSIRSFTDSLSGVLSIFASVAILLIARQIVKQNFEKTPCNHPRTDELMLRCQQLEHQLAVRDSQYEDLQSTTATSHAKYLRLEKHYISNEERYRGQCEELEQRNTLLKSHYEQRRKDFRLLPITLFTERLILANKMWQQKKVTNETQNQLVLREKQVNRNAFEAFGDKLLLSNVIWRQQTELKGLREEVEKLKKGRIRAISSQAKRMVVDTRREGMVGELCKDLTREVEEEKRKVVELQEQHGKEVKSVTAEWETKYRELLREVECLRLGQEARLIEQEISNDMEDRLRSRIKELEGGF
ncbi:hypothetical protein D9758_010434 [Tetrapyrgos nigripes]|uniref:Uncharacterized protein n=1 Tax=Tetrapyrgos nigripes TaxID=182062 RepID=A0A8H5FQ45_9AGAR|nr:hypothetical protein D9758_010434 [Tetrapyrgos nigripes]